MEYQKIVNLLENKAWNQPSRIRTKNGLKKMMNQEDGILLGILESRAGYCTFLSCHVRVSEWIHSL